MRPWPEHLGHVLALAEPLAPVRLPPTTGVVLAVDADAVLSVPPFANSAMDGVLVNRTDLTGAGPWRLPLVGDVPAGAPPHPPGPGEAVRIMTGAPTGANPAGLCVVPVEHTDLTPGPQDLPRHVVIHAAPRGDHIRAAGENIAAGGLVIPAGTALDAGALAALISTGVTEVTAHPRPAVAVISSGDELAAPGAPLIDGHLPDSNRPMLAALATANGAGRVREHHATDTPDDFRRLLDDSAAGADLLITTGGISAGAYDVVKAVTSSGDLWFGSVGMKPGAPQGAGRWRGTPLLCLPGNPVAAFVSFHLFVAPVLRRLAGRRAEPDRVRARAVATFPTATDVTRVIPTRLDFAGDITARPFDPRGRSHLVASLADTHGLAILDPGADGDILDVILTRT